MIYDKLTPAMQVKTKAILVGVLRDHQGVMFQTREMAAALALLTSTLKAEREQGKQMVRDWRFDNKEPA